MLCIDSFTKEGVKGLLALTHCSQLQMHENLYGQTQYLPSKTSSFLYLFLLVLPPLCHSSRMENLDIFNWNSGEIKEKLLRYIKLFWLKKKCVNIFLSPLVTLPPPNLSPYQHMFIFALNIYKSSPWLIFSLSKIFFFFEYLFKQNDLRISFFPTVSLSKDFLCFLKQVQLSLLGL